MSGWRVDVSPFGSAIETTWANEDGTPYTEAQATAVAKPIRWACAWWDAEMWPVDRRNNEQGNAA